MQIDHHSTELYRKEKGCFFNETPCIPQAERHCVFPFFVGFDFVFAGAGYYLVVLVPLGDGLWICCDCTLEDRLATGRLTNATIRQRDLWSDC